MWFNAAFTGMFAPKTQRGTRLWPRLCDVIRGLSVTYGVLRLQSVSEDGRARKISVAAVQGNVDIDMKWNPLLAHKKSR